MKPLFLKITTLAVIVLSLAMPLDKVWADNSNCEVSEKSYGIIQTVQNFLDIRRTVTNMFASLVTDAALTTIVQANPNQMMKCASYDREHYLAVGLPDLGCTLTQDEINICESIFNNYAQTKIASSTGGPNYKDNIVAGSMLGFAYFLENKSREPMPVNLAYFFSDQFKNVPMLNKAFAAPNYPGPLGNLYDIQAILQLWKLSRNIAYGLISIFLIVIGILMIMRKKVDQQTVVNIQYALPKIVMVLILIPFSYPIGATIASFAWASMFTAIKLVNSAIGGAAIVGTSTYGLGHFLVDMIGILLFTSAGVFFIAIFAISCLIIIGMFIWFMIKVFITYFKLIVAIIASPLVFAFGTIPGNESKISDWFKSAIANALSLPAMAAVLSAGFAILSNIISSGTNVVASVAFGILIMPFILIFSLYYASKMPGIIETAIVGEPKKTRR